jgi:putative transposase
MLEELTEFIQSNPDPRELKRAITVQMQIKGYKQREIQESLSVSSGVRIQVKKNFSGKSG